MGEWRHAVDDREKAAASEVCRRAAGALHEVLIWCLIVIHSVFDRVFCCLSDILPVRVFLRFTNAAARCPPHHPWRCLRGLHQTRQPLKKVAGIKARLLLRLPRSPSDDGTFPPLPRQTHLQQKSRGVCGAETVSPAALLLAWLGVCRNSQFS